MFVSQSKRSVWVPKVSLVASPHPLHSLRSAPGQLQCLFSSIAKTITLCHRCNHCFIYSCTLQFHLSIPSLFKKHDANSWTQCCHGSTVGRDPVVHLLILTRTGVTVDVYMWGWMFKVNIYVACFSLSLCVHFPCWVWQSLDGSWNSCLLGLWKKNDTDNCLLRRWYLNTLLLCIIKCP